MKNRAQALVLASFILTSCIGGCDTAELDNDNLVPQLAFSWTYMRDAKVKEFGTGRYNLAFLVKDSPVFGRKLDKKIKELRTTAFNGFRKTKSETSEDQYNMEHLYPKTVELLKEDRPSFYIDASQVLDEIKKDCDKLGTDSQIKKCVYTKMIYGNRALALSRKHNLSHSLIFRGH